VISPSTRWSSKITRSDPRFESSGEERVTEREAGQRRQLVVDLGIVLHRAGAERIEAAVEVVVQHRQLDEMTDHFGLTH